MTTFRASTRDARAEYLPDGEQQPSNGAGEGKGLLWITILSTRSVLLDRRLAHGATRIYGVLTEFSFCRRHICLSHGLNAQGDGLGGIEVSIDELTRAIGANARSVTRWLRELVRYGYIWIDKLKPTQVLPWRHHKYFLSAVVPPASQKELPLVGSSANAVVGTTANDLHGTTANAVVGTTANLIGRGTERREGVSGRPVRQAVGEGGLEPPKYLREAALKIQFIEGEVKKLMSNRAHFKWVLAPQTEEAIKWLESEAAKLEKSRKAADKLKAKEHRAEAQRRRADPANLVRGALLPTAAARKANLTRQKADLERLIIGEEAPR